MRAAAKRTGNTGDHLIQALESRLDALVLRAGFATSIYAARQLVSHGHIQVNGRRVDFPSAPVKAGSVIGFRASSRGLDAVKGSMDKTPAAPYLRRDDSQREAELLRIPAREEIPVLCELSSVVEFYAK